MPSVSRSMNDVVSPEHRRAAESTRQLMAAYQESRDLIEIGVNDYDLVPALIAEYPITGRGASTFLPSEYFILDNQMLGTLIQTGILGLIGILALYATGFLLPRHVRHLAGNEGEVARLAQTMCGAVFAGFVATFTFDSHGFPLHRTMLFITIGLGTALWRLANEGLVPGIESAEERRNAIQTSR